MLRFHAGGRTISRFMKLGLALGVLAAGVHRTASAQIVINELVKEERTAGSGSVSPDTREFIELYNAGQTEENLANWSIAVIDLLTGISAITDTIPSGTIAPGGYFVIGGSAVPNVDFSPVDSDLYPDTTAHLIELKNSSGTLVDAVAYEVYRSGLSAATPDQLAQVGSGYQGQLISMNANAPNEVISWGRYRDGVDTNRNGYDFGLLPVTPGTSNNLPQSQMHVVPDVDGLAPGTSLSDDYYASFVMPQVINPTVASGINPRAIPASPQGGNAIVAWDGSGGGNTSLSKELVNSFDLYAYFDTTPLGVAADTDSEEWETSAFGIGSADAFYGTPDPTGTIYVEGTITQNSSTGIGWIFQQYEFPDDPDTTDVDEYFEVTQLLLVDYGDGGNSLPASEEWTVIETLDMSGVASGWYRLAMDYDQTTGEVTAIFDDDTYTFTTETDLVGNFVVGYREGITDQGSRFDKLNPAIYDLYVETAVDDADFNDDGIVNLADYTVWRNNLGATEITPYSLGDGNGDGAVDSTDYGIWKNQFGQINNSLAGLGGSQVPEPSCLWLLLTALACIPRVRYRIASAISLA